MSTQPLQKIEDRRLQSPRVIVCEGADEYDVLDWIRRQRGLSDKNVELINAKGRTNLRNVLDDLRFQSGGSDVKLVGVVLDAEELSDADKALQNGLREVALDRGFGFCVHVLPDDQSRGALETLVRLHTDAAAPENSCANAWEQCLAPSMLGDRTTAKKDKAWSQVWLAGQSAFYSRLGVALVQDPDVRTRLHAVVLHFEALLDRILSAPLD